MFFSYTLSHEYLLVKKRYSRLLFTSEDRRCANLRVQEQSTNMTSQCLYPTFAWRHWSTVSTSKEEVRNKLIHSLPWIKMFGHSWCNLPMIFTSDLVTRENYWQIASLVTEKSLFTATHALFYAYFHLFQTCFDLSIALFPTLTNLVCMHAITVT